MTPVGAPRLLVVGSGIAGLTAALEASATHRVTVLAKAAPEDSSTRWAQGGVAAVSTPTDSVADHVRDTLTAGAGLSDAAAAQVLCAGGPDALATLLARGVDFDREQPEEHRGDAGRADAPPGLAHGLEAAHSHARILHAGGDATGARIVTALLPQLARSGIEVRAGTTVTDLVVGGGRVTGVRLLGGETLSADAVLLATGGAGQLFPFTTNPLVATADGVAMALRAGAVVADLEMYQFHPTALDLPGSFLVSEAVRGEGAVLRDARGRRFMTAIHPDAELAPRDVVARAIATVMAEQGRPVLLDATALGADFLARRFPTIDAACRRHGLDWGRTPVPVTPAAHYAMGGVRTDSWGRTSLPGLLAVGEVACTGLHGANRLASNSLLEGAVYGARAAAGLRTGPPVLDFGPDWAEPTPLDRSRPADAEGAPAAAVAKAISSTAAAGTVAAGAVTDGTVAEGASWTRAELQQLMWSACGLSRDATELAAVSGTVSRWRVAAPTDQKSAEDTNLLLVAQAMLQAAAARTESRGGHFRRDHPTTDPRQAVHRSLVMTRPGSLADRPSSLATDPPTSLGDRPGTTTAEATPETGGRAPHQQRASTP